MATIASAGKIGTTSSSITLRKNSIAHMAKIPLLDLQSYQDLQSRALAAKIQLSSRDRTTIVHSHNGKSIKVELTREEFETMTKHLVEKCKAICEIVMREARCLGRR